MESVTLLEIHVNADSVIRLRSWSFFKSNSWLPNVAKSSPIALRTETICLPANSSPSITALPRGDGLRASPERTVNVRGFCSTSLRRISATRLRPPKVWSPGARFRRHH